jgi:hypothetical protein
MKTPQWYAIHRPDGIIQYATKYDSQDGYFLYGSGFKLDLDAVKIEPIEGDPPIEYVAGKVAVIDSPDDTFENGWRCFVNKNHRWNGWYVPYIIEDDIQRWCEESWFNEENVIGHKWTFNGEKLYFKDLSYPEDSQEISPTMINGIKCYLIDIGYCFDFEKL